MYILYIIYQNVILQYEIYSSMSEIMLLSFQLRIDNTAACDGPLTRYVKLWVAHESGMPGTFFPPPRVSDPDKYHGDTRGDR